MVSTVWVGLFLLLRPMSRRGWSDESRAIHIPRSPTHLETFTTEEPVVSLRGSECFSGGIQESGSLLFDSSSDRFEIVRVRDELSEVSRDRSDHQSESNGLCS